MYYYDIIKTKIQSILGTEKYIRFMIHILNSPKYGAINQTNESNTVKAIQGVIDLYEEWLNTGVKPEQGRWLKAKAIATNVYHYTSSTASTAATVTDNVISVMAATASWTAHANNTNGIPYSEVEKAQIEYTESLINEDLYTEEEYEKVL